MIYKLKLSTTGRNLLTKIYENNNYYTKPKKNCIKKILHNLFTSNYDLEIEKIANDMYTSSQKIYENIFNSYLIKKYNRTAIYNIIILILTNGETTLTAQAVKYNIGFYLNLAINAMKNNDHQTAIIIKAALESNHLSTINIKYNKSMERKLKLLNETYGFYNNQYLSHLLTCLKKFRHKYFIPSTLALNMILNRELIKNNDYVLKEKNTKQTINYKFYEICKIKNQQYRSIPVKLCNLYKTDPLSLSITKVFVDKNTTVDNKDEEINKLLSKFNLIINHQINLK